MKAEYKRDLQNNYLILEVPDKDEEEDYQVQMVEKNEIPGLLSFHSSRRNGSLLLHYEITSKQSLETVYERKIMGTQDIVLLLSGIREVLETLQKYLLNPAHLIFDPVYVYMESGRSNYYFCYFPEKENGAPITLLAEFVLKKINHEDRQAVLLGYSFYQKTLEENFSLYQALKEILEIVYEERPESEHLEEWEYEKGWRVSRSRCGEGQWEVSQRGVGGSQREDVQKRHEEEYGEVDQRRYGEEMGEIDQRRYGDKLGEAVQRRYGEELGDIVQRRYEEERESEIQRSYGEKKKETLRGRGRKEKEESFREKKKKLFRDGIKENLSGQQADWEKEESNCLWETRDEDYEVIHKERKKCSENRIDALFHAVHPAVCLSFLFLFAVLEILFYFGYIYLTEAGGLFFLLISVELLANKFWKNSIKRKKEMENRWITEPDEEMYHFLQEEMYMQPKDKQEIEETRCLSRDQQKKGLHLVYVRSGNHGIYPDIYVEKDPIYVGKMKQDSDVILNLETVSRQHARLDYQNEHYYVKDLNSKNGTFLNGKRLNPQEQCEIAAGDWVAFAEIEYRADIT